MRGNVRRAVLEILAAEDTRFVDERCAERFVEFSSRDRHLLQEVVYGTVRHQNTLDRLLKLYLKITLPRQRPTIRWALRAGAYQLVYLTRIPAHAAVNQTLEALKGLDGVTARDVGFVNAVLHRLCGDIVRKEDSPPENRDDPNVLTVRQGYCHFNRPVLSLLTLDRIDHLSVKYSHPRWLIQRWLERFGEEEARALLERNNQIAPITARVTRAAPGLEAVRESLSRAGFQVSSSTRDDAIVVSGGGELDGSEALAKGWIQIQDVTAMAIGAILKPSGPARVLDLCASPGGKALQLLDALEDTAELVATDRSEEKLAPVRENLTRSGRTNWSVAVVPDDPAAIDLGRQFTHVLVDAPCSNTGVLARRPDARWRIRREDLESLGGIQSGLLEAAYRHLAPGGKILYSTCSLEPEENEERVAAFLAAHEDLEELDAQSFLPHRSDGDGGYCSLICRRAGGAGSDDANA